MNLRAIFPIWILLPVFAAGIGFCIWQVTKQKKRNKKIHWIVRAVLVGLLLLIGLRPGISSGNAEAAKNNLDVYVLLDRSGSMLAEDYQGQKTRFSGAREDLKKLGEALSGARFSIISFSHYAQQYLPLTDNADSFNSAVDSVAPQLTTYSRGSSISAGIDLAKERLEKNVEKYKNERVRAIVYVGDGEQTSDKSPESFSELGKLSDSALVLGYGTPSGAKMREYAPYTDEPRYVYDYETNGDAISKYDEGNLTKIAQELGGEFAHRTTPSGIEDLANKLLASTRQIEAKDEQGGRFEFYWIIAILAVIVSFYELQQLVRLLGSIKTLKENA